MFGRPFVWLRGIFILCAWIGGALTLTGCESASSEIGTIAVNRSIDGLVAGIVGKSQSLQLTFTAIGTPSLSNFTIRTGLTSLPSWSGPANFSCASVNTDGACKLDLVFTPQSAGSGTLTLSYSYQGTSGKGLNGSVSVDYSAVAANTVQTNVSPSGQIDAIVGTGTRAVSVTFNTNDSAATALAVTTDLSQLPAGWHIASNSFACSEVNTGNGCQLQLSYAPTVVGSGTLVVNYRYDDNAGITRNASVSIDYSATSHNNLAATPSPSGQINVAVGGSGQSVQVVFTTDDGNSVSNVAMTSSLTGLTSGWSSATPTFACATASTGNGCQLSLTYAPTATGSGTLTLDYSYNDNAGAAQVGHINIPYIATANNNVVASVSPSGQIVTAVGATSPATVTFATDDANSASSLAVTTNLSTLPSGWSSPSPSFDCSTVNSGTSCQMPLSFAPSSGVSGTLQINYSYTNNAGTAKTGSVSIPYLGTATHAYIGQLSGNIIVCEIGSNGLLSNCANSGIRGNAIAISGSHAYAGDYSNSVIRHCDLAANGNLTNCAITGSNYFNPFVMTASGNILYATSASGAHNIMYCPIQSNGTVGACAETTTLNGGEGLNTHNGYLYVGRPHDGAGTVYVCQQAVDGTLSACANTGSGFNQTQDIAISGNFAFVANTNDGTISTCAINGSTGALSACSKSTVASGPMGVAIHNDRAYVSTRSGNVHVCDVNVTTGALSNCVVSNGGASLGLTVQIAIH